MELKVVTKEVIRKIGVKSVVNAGIANEVVRSFEEDAMGWLFDHATHKLDIRDSKGNDYELSFNPEDGTFVVAEHLYPGMSEKKTIMEKQVREYIIEYIAHFFKKGSGNISGYEERYDKHIEDLHDKKEKMKFKNAKNRIKAFLRSS